MNQSSLDAKKEQLKKIQQQIKNEEKKIERNLGKKLIQELDLDYSKISNKEEIDLFVLELVELYNLKHKPTSTVQD